jgi:hypothetical protein
MSDFLKINRNGQILEIILLNGIEKTKKLSSEMVARLCSGKDPNT